MSMEIIKRETIEETVARWTSGAVILPHSPGHPPRRPSAGSQVIERPLVLHLPRICALHDKRWFARIALQPNGRYVYNGSHWFEGHHGVQYAEENLCELARIGAAAYDNNDAEQCPCGARGPAGHAAIIWCGCCAEWVCRARSAQDYFQCRPSCPGKGKLGPSRKQTLGIVPRFPRANSLR